MTGLLLAQCSRLLLAQWQWFMPPRINDLPSSVLFAILTEYPCADLVHH
eukprot:COSAG04_NODE_22430_length_355_cov_0.609375_1_plen_48_part_10